MILAIYESAAVRPARHAVEEAADDRASSGPRLAVNPIAYWLAGGVPDRTTRTLGPAFTELAEIGYTAVKADVPDDMAPTTTCPGSRRSGWSRR